jgi:low affinity Fe/Cu permease
MWILFILICLGVGIFANKKFNRRWWLWTILAILFSPLFTFILLYFIEYVWNTTPEKFSREILDLNKLYKNRIISKEEYEFNKNSLISKLRNDKPEEFLVKIVPLIQNNILTNGDINKIKRKLNGRIN